MSNTEASAVPAAELGVVRPFDRVEWVDEAKFGRASQKIIDQARNAGARRKFMSQGEQGLYVQYSTFPPGFEVPAHTHTHGEVLYVLSGSCTVQPGGNVLGPNDSAVVPGGFEYGFVCGEQGMEFLTIRNGDANTAFSG